MSMPKGLKYAGKVATAMSQNIPSVGNGTVSQPKSAEIDKDKKKEEPIQFSDSSLNGNTDIKSHLSDSNDLSKPFNMQMGSSIDMFGNDMSKYSVLSDERMKSLFGKDKSLDCFGKINAYMFKYKPEAQQAFKDKDLGVDDKVHVGVMAQELKSNPITSSTVNSDPMSGILTVDTKQLTMTNTAMIAELTRKVDMLEKILMEITHDKR